MKFLVLGLKLENSGMKVGYPKFFLDILAVLKV